MCKSKLTFITIAGLLLAFTGQAQDTNTLKTVIQVFEAQTDTVVIKGFKLVGSVSAAAGKVSVLAKESTGTANRVKLYGMAVVFDSNQQREMAVIDYNELDSLIAGIDYLAKITSDASSMSGFEAGITTKSGFRVIAFSSQRKGAIQYFLQFSGGQRISLLPEQLTQFENLVSQAKASLDSLRSGK
ncbi:MAG TPA: hypothetical protein VKA67_05125 [Verrucomicrobiae bacterium]|nr:hypothetical protein [Verrucomicrobiae bacterium]